MIRAWLAAAAALSLAACAQQERPALASLPEVPAGQAAAAAARDLHGPVCLPLVAKYAPNTE